MSLLCYIEIVFRFSARMAKVAVILVVIFIVLNLPRLAIGVFEVKVLLGPKNGLYFLAPLKKVWLIFQN